MLRRSSSSLARYAGLGIQVAEDIARVGDGLSGEVVLAVEHLPEFLLAVVVVGDQGLDAIDFTELLLDHPVVVTSIAGLEAVDREINEHVVMDAFVELVGEPCIALGRAIGYAPQVVRTELLPVPFHEVVEPGNGDEQIHRDHRVLLGERPMELLGDAEQIVRAHKWADE